MYQCVPHGSERVERIGTGIETRWGTNPVASFAYDHDAVGRRTRRVDSELTTNLFGYKMRSELVNAIMGTNFYAYAYDPIGNRQQASASEVTNLYQANELNQYTNIIMGTVEPVYDADGNMTTLGSWQFTWDAENRLVKASPRVLITGSRIYEYEYDYMGRRVKKTEKRHTMPVFTWTMRTFDYDGWNLVRERVEFDGAVSTNQYIWGLDLSGTLQGAGGVGGLLAMLTPDSCLLTPAYDANGNVTDLVDTNGTVVAHYEYDPYGNTIAQSGAQADANPFRFSTKYWDGETGFYYYGYRFYSPELGRWLSRDPIGEAGGVNTIVFMGNSPQSGYDYLGLSGNQLVSCPCDEAEIDRIAYQLTKKANISMVAKPVYVDGMPYNAEWCGLVCCAKDGAVYEMGPLKGNWEVEKGQGQYKYEDVPPGRPTCAKVFEYLSCGKDRIVRRVHTHPYGGEPEFSSGDEGYCRLTNIPLTVSHLGQPDNVIITCGHRIYRLFPNGLRVYIRNI